MDKILVVNSLKDILNSFRGIFSDYFEYKTRLAELRTEEYRIDAQAKVIIKRLEYEFQENMKKLSIIESYLINTYNEFLLTSKERYQTKQKVLSIIDTLIDKLTTEQTTIPEIEVLNKTLNIFSDLVIKLEEQSSNDYRQLLLSAAQTLEVSLPKLLGSNNKELLKVN
jgi:hypothetical protein